MSDIEFARCRSLKEVLDLKAARGEGAAVLAGGTDLAIRLRDRGPGGGALTLCDITPLSELRFIREEGGGLALGPLTTHAELTSSPLLRAAAPALADAAGSVGSTQIRAMGTIGGNVCNASPCADTVPALLLCDAMLTLSSASGEREVPLGAFIKGPYRTLLRPDEVLTRVSLRPPARGSGMAFFKLGRRNACSIARMNFAAAVRTGGGGVIEEARVAAGSVTPTAMRFTAIEGFLKGKAPTRDLCREAGVLMARIMVDVSGRRWSTPYKEPVSAALCARVLVKACGL